MALPNTFKPQVGGGGRYTLSSLKSGEKVKVRVLTDFVTGNMVWSDLEDGRRQPFRSHENQSIPTSKIGTNPNTHEPERIRQFIACVVWNYAKEQVEIFETSKATIIDAIYELENSEEWGDSKTYDITVSKSGTGMETKYSVLPSNMKPFKCEEDWKSVNLEALFEGKDPFTQDAQVEQATENKSVAEEVADSIPF